MMPLGIWLGQTGIERALLVGSLLLVLIVELVNSAIEAVVDRFGGEQHELSGRAKDIGSAAVFIALLNVAIIWGLVLINP
jgi:diacylglycerol kinase (ATP)